MPSMTFIFLNNCKLILIKMNAISRKAFQDQTSKVKNIWLDRFLISHAFYLSLSLLIQSRCMNMWCYFFTFNIVTLGLILTINNIIIFFSILSVNDWWLNCRKAQPTSFQFHLLYASDRPLFHLVITLKGQADKEILSKLCIIMFCSYAFDFWFNSLQFILNIYIKWY